MPRRSFTSSGSRTRSLVSPLHPLQSAAGFRLSRSATLSSRRSPNGMGKGSAGLRSEKAARALGEAAQAHQRGDIATAKRLYRRVLKTHPHHYKALRLSGLLAYETGDTEQAIQFLNAASRYAPEGDPGPLEDLGLIYLQCGGQERAEDLLRRAVEIKPDSLPALSRLGSALVTCGRGSVMPRGEGPRSRWIRSSGSVSPGARPGRGRPADWVRVGPRASRERRVRGGGHDRG